MTFAPVAYLRWAGHHYGNVSFDLGRSGIFGANRPSLDVPPGPWTWRAWDDLRARIAAYNGVAVDEALPALGTSHGLWLAHAALLSPGDEVLLEDVTYEPMRRVAEGLGARVTTFARTPDTGFALDSDRVARALTDKTRLVVLSNLHNPSGARASDDSIAEIARLAAKRGAHVLVDEVYAPFESLCDERGVWGRSARHLGPNVVAVGSLTKCYGLGDHRIGWVVGPREVIARGEDAMMASVGHLPFPWMAVAVRAFDQLPTIAAWSRATLASKRARVEAWLAERPHLTWSHPREGLFGFAIDSRTDADLTSRIEAGIRDEGVVVAPGVFFGIPNGFRLAWSIEADRLDEALGRLGRVLD